MILQEPSQSENTNIVKLVYSKCSEKPKTKQSTEVSSPYVPAGALSGDYILHILRQKKKKIKQTLKDL